MPLPATATKDFDALLTTYEMTPILFPRLKAVSAAQWALESGWGGSNLAGKFRNYGGAKWRTYMAPYATPVKYAAHDGIEQYCHFPTHEKWIAGYWARFDLESAYNGWRGHVDTPEKFLSFIGPIWLGLGKEKGDEYVRKVARIHDDYKFAAMFSESKDALLSLQDLVDRFSRGIPDSLRADASKPTG